VHATPAPTAKDPFADWCRGIRASDPRALAELFHHTHDPLVGYAVTLTGDRATARDLVQEAFVKLWERRERLDPSRSLRSLLFRMVRNRALNMSRDQQNRDHLLSEHFLADQPSTPDDELDGSQLRRQLERWMAELPERQREALRLSRFEGLAHDEIAEVMEISPRTVNNHLVKALRHLRQRVSAFAPHLLQDAA
jgi:RNA polymerase sigma-70 factor (family 1)